MYWLIQSRYQQYDEKTKGGKNHEIKKGNGVGTCKCNGILYGSLRRFF